MERQVNFLNSLITNKSLLFDFLVDPMKIIKISEVDKDPVFEKFALNLYRKLCDLIEADFTRLNESGDEKFRKIMFLRLADSARKDNNYALHKSEEKEISEIDQQCTHTPEFCVHSSSECANWIGVCDASCTYESPCQDSCSVSSPCLDNSCYQSVTCVNEGQSCHKTDADYCLDTQCRNIPTSGFCQDFSGCQDTTCENRHCGDTGGCIDLNNCRDSVQCQDGGQIGGCTDNGCLNGSPAGKTQCLDMTNCLDAQNCSNEGSECTDKFNCVDSSGCTNHTSRLDSGKSCEDNSCTNVISCIDRNECKDSQCANESFCKDTSGCSDEGCGDENDCPSDSQCTDTECADSECHYTGCSNDECS